MVRRYRYRKLSANKDEIKSKYISYLQKKVKDLEVIASKFGCYENGKPIVCLHCPHDRYGHEPSCKFTSLLKEPLYAINIVENDKSEVKNNE